MAANKEAIVILLDVGPSMCEDGLCGLSTLQTSKHCIQKIIERKIFSDSKDEVALVLFGTPETANDLSDLSSDDYARIMVARDLKQVDWDLLRYIQSIEGSSKSADFVDAIVVAMDILINQTKGQKFSTFRILLISNFGGEFCEDQIDVIIDGIRNANVEINVISSIGLTDGETDMKPKNEQQNAGVALIKRILQETNGEAYLFDEAIPALIYYQKKKVRPSAWNAVLEVGPSLSLPVTGYIKVTEFRSKTWKEVCVQRRETKIIKETTYHLSDDAQTEVGREDIIPGYRYGTTLVPFTEEDKINMEYTSGDKGIKVLGFTKKENVKQHYYVGSKTMFIVSQKGNESGGKALSAFIHSLYETSMVAVVRYVHSGRSLPAVGVLFPRIKPDYECLVYTQLPFMEDIRHYTFSPLDACSRNLPTEEQLTAVEELINTMDLTKATLDENNRRSEAMKSKNIMNPYFQRLYQCLQHRVFNPNSSLPDIPTHIKAFLEPAKELITCSKPAVEKLKKLFSLKHVAQKRILETGASLFQNGDKQHSKGLEAKHPKLDNSLKGGITSVISGTVTEVGTVNPVDDFRHLLDQSEISYKDVYFQLQKVIHTLLSDHMGKALYSKIMDCLRAYRSDSLKRTDPSYFNLFLVELKERLSGNRQEFWHLILSEKMTLINKEECDKSEFSETDAQLYLTSEERIQKAETQIDEDEEDLIAQM